MSSLNKKPQSAKLNQVSYTGNEKIEIGLSTEELKKRTHKDYLATKKMLEVGAPEYEALAEGDKVALKHLVKAASALDEVYPLQDHPKNKAFESFLKSEIKKGNEDAKRAMVLYKAQKGLAAVDTEANKFSLMKGEQELPQKAFYPADLTKEEFHNILIKMLEKEKTKEVGEILNQRSIVVRDGKGLKAVPFTTAFAKQFKKAAGHLELAADASTNKDFAEFLRLQAQALKEENPMLDGYADKKWATLQDTPLEFTITRENYEDEMTETVFENPRLKQLLDEKFIEPVSKDSLGFRVGIVNKEGTEALLSIKKFLPELAKEMPFANKYEQNISANLDDVKQTMVDVDLVAVKGDVGAWRGGITLAENLPNDDKLSVSKLDGGRRNVYHRQIRAISDYKKLQEKLDAILEKDLHQYYENEADHWFTIGHENAHSLGPKSGTEGLGKYKSIIEENKADMAALSFVDKLTEFGHYTPQQRKQILVTFVADNLLKAKPNMSQAHRVRSVMQMSHLMQEGAVSINDKGFVHVEIDKMVPAARKMLEEIIEIQMSGDFKRGEEYVLRNFNWNDGMELIAQKLKKINKTLNGRVEEKLARHLLRLK